jgi:hypothetical protein
MKNSSNFQKKKMKFEFNRAVSTSQPSIARLHPTTLRRLREQNANTPSLWFEFATLCFGADESAAAGRLANAYADRAVVMLAPDNAVASDVVLLPDWIEQCVGASRAHKHVKLTVFSRNDDGAQSATTDTNSNRTAVRRCVQIYGSYQCAGADANFDINEAMQRQLCRATLCTNSMFALRLRGTTCVFKLVVDADNDAALKRFTVDQHTRMQLLFTFGSPQQILSSTPIVESITAAKSELLEMIGLCVRQEFGCVPDVWCMFSGAEKCCSHNVTESTLSTATAVVARSRRFGQNVDLEVRIDC